MGQNSSSDTPDFLKALGNPKRWRIFHLTAQDPWCVTDLAHEVGMAQPSMSRHLEKLKKFGVVTVEPSDGEDGVRVSGVRTEVAELERRLAEAVREIHPYGLVGIEFKTETDGETRTWR